MEVSHMASEKDKLTKLSVSLLPIEDIKNLLYYEHDFMRVGDNATDVDAVAGIEADKIAVAVSKDNRETIKNSPSSPWRQTCRRVFDGR